MSPHVRAQALRFARVSLLALGASYVVAGRWPGWAGLWALVPGALEAGLRQMLQTEPVATVTSVLAPPAPPGPGA